MGNQVYTRTVSVVDTLQPVITLRYGVAGATPTQIDRGLDSVANAVPNHHNAAAPGNALKTNEPSTPTTVTRASAMSTRPTPTATRPGWPSRPRPPPSTDGLSAPSAPPSPASPSSATPCARPLSPPPSRSKPLGEAR